MTIDSAVGSTVLSAVAVSVRVTSWADGPVKVTVTLELIRAPHVTPLGKGVTHLASQSAALTVPPKVTGTDSSSPLTSARFSPTVKSMLLRSGRVTARPASVAVVASLSVTATLADDGEPTV